MKLSKKLLVTLYTVGASTIGTPLVYAAHLPQPSYPSYHKKVTIEWWSWTQSADRVVKAFERAYPDIKVVHKNIGSSTEYTKLSIALKAGSGAPDVVQIAYDTLPQFIDTGGLVDITQYERPYQRFFPQWAWNLVTRAGKIYAVPEDVGPMGLIYQPGVLRKYHLAVPKTWAQFAAEAKTLHAKDKSKYMTFFPYTDGSYVMSLFWKAGAKPFQYTANGWKVDINSATDKRVLNYWANLVKSGAVKPVVDWSPQWEHEIGQDMFVSIPGAAWSPTYEVEPYLKKSDHGWHVSDMPQWSSKEFVDSNYGGSSNAITKQSKHPDAAALFASWINTSEAGLKLAVKPIPVGRGLYPADKFASRVPGFLLKDPFLGNQAPNRVFAKGAAKVDQSFQWSPWSTYVYNQIGVELTKALGGKETWDQALDNVQQKVVQFAKTQGYSVLQ